MNNNATADHFLNVRELVPLLLKYKAENPNKKIAFCFSGGGARGAYFGGVIEAIQQEINKQPAQALLPPEDRWKPDIICGTSAGAIAGFSYWMECLLPGNSAPYACRQSKVWQDISNGNKGSEKLFDNPAIIDFLSKSSVELDNLLDSHDTLTESIRTAIENVDKTWTDIKLVISNAGSFDINKLSNNIQNRLNGLKNDFDNIGKIPSFNIKKPREVFDEIKGKFNSLVNISQLIPGIISEVANMEINQAQTLLKNIKDLSNDIKDGNNRDIGRMAKNLKEFTYKLQDLFKVVKPMLVLTRSFIKKNSSVMNTNGLENVLGNYIFNSFPPNSFQLIDGKLEARSLDTAIIKAVKDKLALNKKVPAFFVTGTNINAKRGVAFSLAPEAINIAVANRNLWVIELGDNVTDFYSHKTAIANQFVFGGKRFGEEYTHSMQIVVQPVASNPIVKDASIQYIKAASKTGASYSAEQQAATVPVSRISKSTFSATASAGRNDTAVTPVAITGANQRTTTAVSTIDPEMDFSKGKSLFAGAVLTSASIPIAFPPRQWTFFSKKTGERYKHWMVDGGIVNNRPVDVAVKAGAEFIISFELTPLLSATTEMKKEVTEYPKFSEVISKSMIDATLNAGFYRYFEDLVTENIDTMKPAGTPPKYTIYRMAPMMYNTPDEADYGQGTAWDDHTPGTYDFNGKFDKDRNLRMGLFDWFMKGYIDAKGGDNIDMADIVNSTYNNLPDSFGAKKNAYLGRRGGFYDASLKAHPESSPPW
jgi:predicted acylesterase/phospholipase RssA